MKLLGWLALGVAGLLIWARRAVVVGLGIIGIAGMPDDIAVWERWLTDTPPWVYDLVGAGLLIIGAVQVTRWAISRFGAQPDPKTELSYLTNRDAELGPAITRMAWRSAWARWYAAQVFANSGQHVAEEHLLHVASTLVMERILDGEIEVRGRLPGDMNYESIPRTDWRSSAFHFVKDPITLWRLIIIPRGGAEIASGGGVTALDPASEARTAKLKAYDSLIVDAFQFEKLFPETDPETDSETRKFLRLSSRRDFEVYGGYG